MIGFIKEIEKRGNVTITSYYNVFSYIKGFGFKKTIKAIREGKAR